MEFATFSDDAPRSLPRVARHPSLLIDASDENNGNDDNGNNGNDDYDYAGRHRPEQSIARQLARAAAASAADEVGGEGGGLTSSPASPGVGEGPAWNMTSGGEWRLVIRGGGGGGGEGLEAGEGDVGKLIFWSLKLCGNSDYGNL